MIVPYVRTRPLVTVCYCALLAMVVSAAGCHLHLHFGEKHIHRQVEDVEDAKDAADAFFKEMTNGSTAKMEDDPG